MVDGIFDDLLHLLLRDVRVLGLASTGRAQFAGVHVFNRPLRKASATMALASRASREDTRLCMDLYFGKPNTRVIVNATRLEYCVNGA